MQKGLVLMLLLTSCTTIYETGEVTVYTCPDCSGAYKGFSTCAFYDVDEAWSREEMLVDDENYAGIGTPIEVPGYMHHKFCFNETHAIAGSANPTVTGLTKNNNLLVLFESEVMAENFASEYDFLQGWSPGFHTTNWFFNNRSIEHYFCPRDNCEEQILRTLHRAEHNITFLTFSFTSDAIGGVLREKHQEGVVVRGVVESWGANGKGAEYSRLLDAGIDVESINTPGIMHHKLFVVDEEIVVLGSYNPTANANTRNSETVLIVEEPLIISSVLAEFRRLVN